MELYNFFYIFLDDNLLKIIISGINKYADHSIRNSNLWRNCRARKWEATLKKKNEILVFPALNILQGTVEKPDIEQYCSKRNSTSVPFFFLK